MSFDLTDRFISQSYQEVIHVVNNTLYDGTGSLVIINYTGSFSGDGSGLTNLPIAEVNTGSLVTTQSFNSFTSSYSTGSFTGSFFGSIDSASYSQFSPYTETIGFRVYTEDLYIESGVKGYRYIPNKSTITRCMMLSDVSGSVTMYVSNNGTLIGSQSLTNESQSIDTTLSGWNTQINSESLLRFYVSQSVYITDLHTFLDITTTQ